MTAGYLSRFSIDPRHVPAERLAPASFQEKEFHPKFAELRQSLPQECPPSIQCQSIVFQRRAIIGSIVSSRRVSLLSILSD